MDKRLSNRFQHPLFKMLAQYAIHNPQSEIIHPTSNIQNAIPRCYKIHHGD